MAAPTSSSAYRAVDDALYSMSSQPCPVDKDTSYTVSSYVSPNGAIAGSPTSPLNKRGATTTTTIEIAQDAGFKLRYGGLGLRLGMVITDVVGSNSAPSLADGPNPTHLDPHIGCDKEAAASCNVTKPIKHKGLKIAPVTKVANSPPWNLASLLISTLKVEFNSGAPFYNSAEYATDYLARMIRHYDADTLSRLSEQLFTPVFDDHGLNIYTASLDLDNTSVYPGDVECDDATYERGTYYCVKSDLTEERYITKIIPFTDLFPRIPDLIYSNLRKIKLTITWTPTDDLLEHFANDEDTWAYVKLISADVVTQKYAMSPSQAAASLEEKMTITPDYIPTMKTLTHNVSYTGSSLDHVLPGIRNFDSIMIFQVAKGVASATDVMYQSPTQFLFGQKLASSAGCKVTAWDKNGATSPFTSVQISYGGRMYPESPLDTAREVNGGTRFEASGLYTEYMRAINVQGSKNSMCAIPYHVFESTMPFVFFRPFASDAPKPSNEGRDLRIMIKGSKEACNLVVVIFTYDVYALTADGVLTQF